VLFYVQVVRLQTPVTEALALLGFLYMAYQKSVILPTAYQKFLSCAGAIVIYRTLDEELNKEIETVSGGGKEPSFDGLLKFEGVSFSYRNNSAKVLDNLSFEVAPRTSVAFVGGSGAGKSTIVNMITGLLQPSSGSLTLSGTSYVELNLEALRERIGYVTQESVIFNDSVHNNICLWDHSRTPEDVGFAAAKASAAEFIEKMPEKYQSTLGDRGVLLSGGQRQRITIARELLRGSPLLILDEATSALDSATEQEIQHELEAAHGERTIIMIAHRLSTVRHCDRIFVLENGRLVESGSYDELYRKGGIFRSMADRQALGGEDV